MGGGAGGGGGGGVICNDGGLEILGLEYTYIDRLFFGVQESRGFVLLDRHVTLNTCTPNYDDASGVETKSSRSLAKALT